MNPSLPEMPDVMDTGTIIGTVADNPAPPLTPQQHAIGAMGMSRDHAIIRDEDEDKDNAMDTTEDEVVDEEDALRTIELLRGDDVSGRVTAARKLHSVAAALGPERTREELLPFLSDGVDDEDEVLEAVASSLGKLVPYVGGPNFASSLLPTLELLLAVEEGVVREKSSASAVKISEFMKEDVYRRDFVGMVGRLATKEWFTARISACGLIPVTFPRMSPEQQETHLEYFANLCRDDAPMVRRIASRNLGQLLYNVVETIGYSSISIDGMVTTTLMDLYELLAGGDQPDSVRLHTTENCVSFGKAMTLLRKTIKKSPDGADAMAIDQHEEIIRGSTESLVKRVLPLIVATIDDRSWRVRYTAASKFSHVVKAFAPLTGTMDALVTAYEKLLQDPEAEVRTAATHNFAEVAKTGAMVYPAGWTGAEEITDEDSQRIPVAERLVKRVMSLTEDESENVRAALAMVATELAPELGKDATITHLLPPMLSLLRDSVSEVRLNIISSLSLLNDVIGAELLAQSLLPAILNLAEDGKWRIRMAVIARIPLMAKQLGKEYFDDKLLSLCVGWLGDDISSIREAAATNLKELTLLLGADWSVLNLVPRINEVKTHSSYLRRMNAIHAFVLIASVMDVDAAQLEVLPTLLDMACDPVPNVRFNVAKGLGTIGHRFSRFVYESQILPVLDLLKDDSDRDVRYFANQSCDALIISFG
mmetsp:Transcript_27051/g.55604  ORF Transcript_27051/g.55604 Transcript_27051/m.55604 type:complete len:706 (-) Transcript_27051:33-2150(-)